MTAESVSSEYPAKPPAWLVDHLEQWRQRRVSGRAGHALIVMSEDVEGASLFSHLLAAQEFCAEASGGSACGQCASCRALAQGVHGDFCVVRRSDGKISIGIDQIRQATQALQQTPLYGSIKVVLIEAADQMTLAAANSLLKILEEPPGNALVLLTTAAMWQLPPTVRSRCQRLSLPPATADQAKHWLETERGMDAETARRALQLAGGKAISAVMLESEGARSLNEALTQSFDEADLSLGPPSIWSKVSAAVLLEGLLLCAERRGREAVLDGQPVATDWLRLHSCVGELYDRVRRGATPAQDILVAEVYRLYRNCGHETFESVSSRFLTSLGRMDLTV
jgi:DNA polymerase-3 subunit delta'